MTETPALPPVPHGTPPGGQDGPRPISHQQQRILDTIRASVADRGYPPSIREIGDAVGLTSSSSVARQLTVLQARGWILREPGEARALTILDHPPTASALRRAALAHAIEEYAGPDDDTIPVLRHWLTELGGWPDEEPLRDADGPSW